MALLPPLAPWEYSPLWHVPQALKEALCGSKKTKWWLGHLANHGLHPWYGVYQDVSRDSDSNRSGTQLGGNILMAMPIATLPIWDAPWG